MTMMPTTDDARVVLDLLREGKTDPELWTHAERSAVTRMHAYRDSAEPDPMDGAIERLIGLTRLRPGAEVEAGVRLDCGTPEGWEALRRLVDLALNEAFRNGMRSEQERHVCEEPAKRVFVNIPSIGRTLGPGVDVQAWPAHLDTRITVGQERDPMYRIEGDVNAVAVGRFKSSLRKFLGVDS